MTRMATLAMAVLVSVTIFAFCMSGAVVSEVVRHHELRTRVLDASVSCGSLDSPKPKGAVYRHAGVSFDEAAEQREAARCGSRLAAQRRWLFLVTGGWAAGLLAFAVVGFNTMRHSSRRLDALPPLTIRLQPAHERRLVQRPADLTTPEVVLLVHGEERTDGVWTLCWFAVLDLALRGLIRVEHRRLPGLVPFRQFVVSAPRSLCEVPPLLAPLMENLSPIPTEPDATGAPVRRLSLVMYQWEKLDTAIGYASLVRRSLAEAGLIEPGYDRPLTPTAAGEALREECLAAQRVLTAARQGIQAGRAATSDGDQSLTRAIADVPAMLAVDEWLLRYLADAHLRVPQVMAPVLPDGFDLQSVANANAALADTARERLS